MFGACVIFGVCLTSYLAAEREEGAFLVKGAKIYTSGSKGVLAEASLLIEKGKIMKVLTGSDLPAVPAIDYSGKCIMPGMVDAHTYISGYYRLLENTKAITSELVAHAAFDPLSPEVEEALAAGITTVNFSPRNENLVGGMTSIFKLTQSLEGLPFLKKEAFLKISFSQTVKNEERPPTSLMGAEAMLNEQMEKATGSALREDVFKEEGISKLVKGDLRPLIAASYYEEISTSLKWLGYWKLKGILVGGEEAHRFAKELREKEVAVLFYPLLFSTPEKMALNIASLLEGGIQIAFTGSLPEGEPLGLRTSALRLCHQGISQEEALKTITLFPAQILGVADSVGSLEEGKDADCVVLSGEPLDLSSKILAVYSNGRLISKGQGQ